MSFFNKIKRCLSHTPQSELPVVEDHTDPYPLTDSKDNTNKDPVIDHGTEDTNQEFNDANGQIAEEMQDSTDDCTSNASTDIAANEEEPTEKVKSFFSTLQDDFLRNSPMFIRLRFMLNALASCRQINKEDNIDWDKVNMYLHENIRETDFNIIPERVSSYEEVDSIHANLCAASVMTSLPWRRCTCIECKETFHLSYSEIEFYENKKLNIPKRCKACRDKRRQNGGK